MKILIAGAEAFPFYKVGGLGDVLGSLPYALRAQQVDSHVVIPKTGATKIPEKILGSEIIHSPVGDFSHIWTERDGVIYHFLGHNSYEGRYEIYKEPDEFELFQIFSVGVASLAKHIDADIVHMNDWHTAFTTVALRYMNLNIKTVLTIHNIAFQGQASPVRLIFFLPEHLWNALRIGTDANILKGGIVLADFVTTVSPSHAKELTTPEFGAPLHECLKKRYEEGTFIGILNGIDTTYWNPLTDPYIPAPYDIEDALESKAVNRRSLRREFGLTDKEDAPLMGIVSRLTHQKGIDIFLETADIAVELGFQIIILGTGEEDIEKEVRKAVARLPGDVVFLNEYSEEKAHKIYAAATHFMMPSRFEPGGLAAMIAMRYGALPIATRTGGLQDSIIDITENAEGTGFLFEGPKPLPLVKAMLRAYKHYTSGDYAYNMKVAMEQDFSWDRSAEKYIEVYKTVLKR
ncbi:MAG: glycogen synthase [Dictyoglomi bacterium]|nr:glycogen synthase [Dictyoglomota bacterium]